MIRGATLLAAVMPDSASTANRRPRFFVFHTRTSSNGSFTAAFATDLTDASSWTSDVFGPVDMIALRSISSALIVYDVAIKHYRS